MIPRADVVRLREQLSAALAEDPHNTELLLARLDSITKESGVGAHAALLLILTRRTFEESDAARHWQAILEHRRAMSEALGRSVGIRVSVLDYFLNVNLRLVQPNLIELDMNEGLSLHAIDPLTGLATDRAFRSAVQAETRRARRYLQKASVVLFDVDALASLNAAVGELVADRLLKEIAILLRNKIRDIDLAARPAEDELALILPETDRNGALLVAERFRSEVESHFSHREAAGRPVRLTVSGGVASYPEDATTAEGLLERAAQALYQAKAAGKNTVQVYRPERRRFLRVDLDPGCFEVEVLSPRAMDSGRARNLGKSGILFVGSEALQVGEEIEIRLVADCKDESMRSPRIRGRVVRLEELPEAPLASDAEQGERVVDRFEIGMAFDLDWTDEEASLIEFFESVERRRAGSPR